MNVQRLIDTGAIAGPYRRTRPLTRLVLARRRAARLARRFFQIFRRTDAV